MNLIGSIKYSENSLAGGKSNQGREKAVPKPAHPVSEKDKAKPALHFASEYDLHLGQLLDTIA